VLHRPLRNGCEYPREVREFFADTVSGGSPAGAMQADDADTMTDTIFVPVASLIVAAGCSSYPERSGEEAVVDDMVGDGPYIRQ
jgi:hypothetical protein